MAMIIISREFAVSATFNKHDVYLNNTYIGTLKTGGELAAHVDVGTQRLFFKDRTFYGAENDAFFDVIINEDSQTVELFAYYNSPGEFVVTYATEPASPLYRTTEPAKPLYRTPSPPASVFRRRKTITCRTCGAQISPRAPRCPHCGEKPLGTALGDGLANFIKGLIFLPFWIILIAISIALYLGFFLQFKL